MARESSALEFLFDELVAGIYPEVESEAEACGHDQEGAEACGDEAEEAKTRVGSSGELVRTVTSISVASTVQIGPNDDRTSSLGPSRMPSQTDGYADSVPSRLSSFETLEECIMGCYDLGLYPEPIETPIVEMKVQTNFVVDGIPMQDGLKGRPVAIDKPLKVVVSADRDMSAFPLKLFIAVCPPGRQALEEILFKQEIASSGVKQGSIATSTTGRHVEHEITIEPRQIPSTAAARDKCKAALNERGVEQNARDPQWTVHLLAEFYGGPDLRWQCPTVQALSVKLNMSVLKNLRDYYSPKAVALGKCCSSRQALPAVVVNAHTILDIEDPAMRTAMADDWRQRNLAAMKKRLSRCDVIGKLLDGSCEKTGLKYFATKESRVLNDPPEEGRPNKRPSTIPN